MNSKRFDILNQLLTEIELYIPFKDEKKAQVSEATVGWHLDHALKVIKAVSTFTLQTDPEDYKWRFNLMRTVLFLFGYIPRGRGQSPKQVLPPDVITEKDLLHQLNAAKVQVETLPNLNENNYFKHFIFGTLNKAQTIRFLGMHTKHHVKIVRDILK
jgi:hypothetical protein